MATVTSVTKHFPVPKEGFTTTAASTIGSGAATVPLNSITGYTNGDTGVWVIEPANATNKQAFTGIVDTAGVQVTSVVWTEGTNTSHAAGSTVVDYVAATHMAMVTKGLLRDHNQSGYHKTLHDDNAATWIGQTVVASAVNYVNVRNSATLTPAIIEALGTDTNINLRMSGKGSGKAHVDGFAEIGNGFVVTGLIWTADAVASTKNASMTTGNVYINGQRSEPIPAVTARVFTASKDTYVDILNTAGVFSVVYTEVTNNAASPALAANSIRIATVVTGATNIAATTSIGQGGFANILPVISSQIFKGFDSLGNIVYPKGPDTPTLNANPYKFSVYRNGAWNTGTANQFNKVAFDTKGFDTHADVDVVTNNRFVAPVAGYYYFDACATAATNNAYYQLAIYKNGSIIKQGQSTNSAAGAVASAAIAGGFLQLVAGDYIEIWLFNNGSSNTGSTGPSATYFDGWLVSAS